MMFDSNSFKDFLGLLTGGSTKTPTGKKEVDATKYIEDVEIAHDLVDTHIFTEIELPNIEDLNFGDFSLCESPTEFLKIGEKE